MLSFRYTLDRSSRKFRCPRCQKKRFVRYVDATVNGYAPSEFGRCDREQSCGYHLNPFRESIDGFSPKTMPASLPIQQVFSTIPLSYVKRSQAKFERNKLLQFLSGRFGEEVVSKLATEYEIGSSHKWSGSTVFWQIDEKGKVRTGKVMLYSEQGKRVKKPFPHVTFAHKLLKLPNFELGQCFFGQHLLKDDHDRPVAIVESEKTALICSVYMPEFVWLATGGKNGVGLSKPETTVALRSRDIILFPDLGAFEDWKHKASGVQCKSIRVSDLLEKFASDLDRDKGFDLADYLIEFAPEQFGKTTRVDTSDIKWWDQAHSIELAEALGLNEFDELTF